MANTLKLGNGKWATKSGSLLAYNDENGNYKPLPFSFSRASSATVVNKDGLIETVGVGEPRIDFKDNTKGALLLEPQRSNLLPYSSEFTGGLIGVSILRDVEPSPDGTISSDKLSDNSASGEHLINSNIALSMVSGTSYTISVFFKSDGTGGQGAIRYYNGSTFHYGVFNLDNGSVSYNSSGTSKIEAYLNGWYRCSISFTAAGSYPNPPVQIAVANASNQFSYQGASNLSIYFWGAQVEQGSYATSYIPTSGSAVTRVADATIGNLPSSSIGQSEGVVYFEGSYLDTSEQGYIQISDGTSNNRIIIWNLTSTLLRGYIVVGGAGQAQITGGIISNNTTFKVALKYKTNDFALWFNGVEVGVDPFGSTFGSNVLNKLDLQFSSVVFEGEVKDLKLYNTALTNAELQALTTI